MARTKQTARKSPRVAGREQPVRAPPQDEGRSELLQLMGLPKQGDASAVISQADWPAVAERLASNPEEARIQDPRRFETAALRGVDGKYPLLLALANQQNPITKEAVDAFIAAFPDIVTKPRSQVVIMASKNTVLCDQKPEVIDTLLKASPYLCGQERTQTFRMMGYPLSCKEGKPCHHYTNYRGEGYRVDWHALETHLRENPAEAKILCPVDDQGTNPLFPLEAALHFRYPPIPLSTVQLLLQLCPEAATIPDSCALTTACCFCPSIYPHSDPEVVRAILRANPAMASKSGLECCTYTYEEQYGLPLHTLVYFMADCGAEIASDLIEAYPEALSSVDSHIYNHTPLRVAAEKDELSTSLLRILLENGHRHNVGQQSGLGQMLMRYEYDFHGTAMAQLIERAFFDRYNWETGQDMRAWENMCLGLKAAGAFKTGLAVEAMWDYPLLQAAIEFGTRQEIVERILEHQCTRADLDRTDALGRTPLAVAIEMAGSGQHNPADPPDDISFPAILGMLLDDEKHGSSQSASILLNDKTRGTSSLPLHRALHHGVGMEDGCANIVDAFPGALSVLDPETNLLPCLLAAVGERARVDTIFGLMIVRPNLIATLCKRNFGGDTDMED